jgi:hypothetical protein
MKIFNFIKNLFSNSNSSRYAVNIISGVGELTALSKTAFIHPARLRVIHQDLITLIVASNFVAKPGTILSFYVRNYDFSIDEFVILSYKLGMLTQTYIDNPKFLLEDALQMRDVFTEETIEYLEKSLNEEIAREAKEITKKVEEFKIKLEDEKNKFNLNDEDDEANKQIDEWLKRNKKN